MIMFQTSIFCDCCGNGFSFPDVVSKKVMVSVARKDGWSIGKQHLCPKCREMAKERKKA